MYTFDWQFKTEESVKPQPVELPKGYGDDRLTLMVRDPYWAFAYWEVSEKRKNELREQVGEQFDSSRLLMKIFQGRNTEEEKARLHMEIDVTGPAMSWYIHLGMPNSSFFGKLGYLTPTGDFHVVVVSNNIRTPRDTFAEEIDSEWMLIAETYQKIFKLVGEVGSSPHILEDLRRAIAKKMEAELAPGSLFPFFEKKS